MMVEKGGVYSVYTAIASPFPSFHSRRLEVPPVLAGKLLSAALRFAHDQAF